MADDNNSGGAPPSKATAAVLQESTPLEGYQTAVRGYDFNNGVDYEALLASYANVGFQARNMSLAVDQINQMLRWRLSDEPVADDDVVTDPAEREAVKCTIFMGFTSNMISCGVRETIRYLAEHKMIDCLVTTGGAVEEDIMKCFNPHLLGDFTLDDVALRRKGINRLGNLLVPNTNYCVLEDWINPLLDRMLEEQNTDGVNWTPSKMIQRFGESLDNRESVWYWCARNHIPVYCPAITDGSIGDMVYFHSFRSPGLRIDIAEDIRGINNIAMNATKTGMIILGGGIVKHHVCNANLMRNGADYSVYINTAHDFDGSDSGAKPSEAISWGKIRIDAHPVKVSGDASLIFPLVVAQTFAAHHHRQQQQRQQKDDGDDGDEALEK